MKKKKLSLEELKVQSFITELKPEHAQTAKGGDDGTSQIVISIIETIQSIVETIQTYNETQDESWWNCYSDNDVDGEVSDKVDEYGCWLPTITICA